MIFMAMHIENLQITAYRGIRDLNIDDLGHVNIIVGGNNSGKTSLLEAIQLFCNPNRYDLMILARQREVAKLGSRRMSLLDSLVYLFDQTSETFCLNIEGKLSSEKHIVDIQGKIVEQLVDLREIRNSSAHLDFSMEDENEETQEEIDVFVGEIKHNSSRSSLEISKYSRMRSDSTRHQLLRTSFVQAFEYVVNDHFANLIRAKDVKDEAISLLKIFDDSISDLRYIKKDRSFFSMVTGTDGNEKPLSVYGDGMKKALTILNAMMSAMDGIVLIDEFETALHTSAMEQVFELMLELSKILDIQLFLTTHNIEAVDKLLECSKENVDDLRVIRIKKKQDKTFARIMTGSEALEKREEFDTELRI